MILRNFGTPFPKLWNLDIYGFSSTFENNEIFTENSQRENFNCLRSYIIHIETPAKARFPKPIEWGL